MRHPSCIVLKVASVVLGTCVLDISHCSAQAVKERITLNGHTEPVLAVAFSPDSKFLASAGNDDTVRLWNLDTGKAKFALKDHACCSLAFSPDGKTLASGAGGPFGSAKKEVTLWDVASGQEKTAYKLDWPGVMGVAFSPDGKTLASGGSSLVQDKALWLSCEVTLWDVPTGKVKLTLKGTQGFMIYPSCIAFSPDGKTLVCGCRNWSGKGEVIVWDFASGMEKARLTSIVNAVAFSPDSKTLATGGEDEPIKLWDIATGKETKQLHGHTKSVWSLAFSPDGKSLASGSEDKTIKLWDVATGKESSTLNAHARDVSCVAFSPDGKTLASASWDKTVKLWDLLPSR